MSDLAKAVTADAIQKLESLAEYVKSTAKQAADVVEKAKQELLMATEAAQLGASETFLGASVMMVGVMDYPLREPSNYSQGRDACLQFDNNMIRVNLHGSPDALKAMRGRYKAVVLMFKVD